MYASAVECCWVASHLRGLLAIDWKCANRLLSVCVCCARVCVSRRLPFIKLKENEHNVRSHSKISNTFPSVYLIDIQGTGGRFNFPPRVTRSNECVGCRSDLDIRLNLVRKLHPFVSSVTYGEARTCLFIDLTLSLVKKLFITYRFFIANRSGEARLSYVDAELYYEYSWMWNMAGQRKWTTGYSRLLLFISPLLFLFGVDLIPAITP